MGAAALFHCLCFPFQNAVVVNFYLEILTAMAVTIGGAAYAYQRKISAAQRIWEIMYFPKKT